MPKTWQAVEKLYDSGKARAVGVSNFTSKKLADLLAIARVPPAVNQVECHPGWQQAKLSVLPLHVSTGVHFSVSQHSFKLAWRVRLWALFSCSNSICRRMRLWEG